MHQNWSLFCIIFNSLIIADNICLSPYHYSLSSGSRIWTGNLRVMGPAIFHLIKYPAIGNVRFELRHRIPNPVCYHYTTFPLATMKGIEPLPPERQSGTLTITPHSHSASKKNRSHEPKNKINLALFTHLYESMQVDSENWTRTHSLEDYYTNHYTIPTCEWEKCLVSPTLLYYYCSSINCLVDHIGVEPISLRS